MGVLSTAPKASLNTDVFFRHMVGNMRNGVLAIARDGSVVLVNSEACRLFDLPNDGSITGQPFRSVLNNQPDVVRVLAGAFEMATLPNRAELRLTSTNTAIGYTLSLVRDDDGYPMGAALLFKDLTEVEEMEERERLRDRLAAVGEMAAVVAHEIKNPLAGIQVLAGLLKRKAPQNPEMQSLVSDILNEAKMANSIVQEVLAFVRPLRLQVARTSLSEAVASAVSLANSGTPRGAIQVNVDIPLDLPLIGSDHHQLTQVFTNLLINAYHALDGRGQVDITARLVHTGEEGALQPEGRYLTPSVLIDVVDNGQGMRPEVAEKIFNPFFTTKQQGSGLGLAIVRKIVDAHGGRIDVSSAAGRGTRFRVTLPLNPPLRVEPAGLKAREV
jgi:signal transduction histidine kinase